MRIEYLNENQYKKRMINRFFNYRKGTSCLFFDKGIHLHLDENIQKNVLKISLLNQLRKYFPFLEKDPNKKIDISIEKKSEDSLLIKAGFKNVI